MPHLSASQGIFHPQTNAPQNTDGMISPHAARPDQALLEAKRRKVRKGTHSCWQCKRRKMKCIFDPPTSNVCNGCRRRGSQCVSQEFTEETSLSRDKMRERSDSTSRGERTPGTPSETGIRTDHGIPTPASMSSETFHHLAFYENPENSTSENITLRSISNEPTSQGRYANLSRFLHASLPSREDTEKICQASRDPTVLTLDALTIPYSTLDQTGLKRANSLLEIPGLDAHPVLISRYMLQLVFFLYHLHPNVHKQIEGLSESSRAIMKRLADLAINLVTTNDELLGNIEGLECVMIETVYQASVGNLRRSWLANRRAMGIAQLMGLNRSNSRMKYKVLDPKTKYSPQIMWFRIVLMDRFLCLNLGFTEGSRDRSMVTDELFEKDTSMGRLERIHCVLASRILERNESNPSSHDFALTRILDEDLQKASRSVPSKWWLTPDLVRASVSADPEALFWDMRRMFLQVFHFNLLNQLHLPYMLRSSSAERKYEYSRITCVNASREMLSRFIAIRSFNFVAFSCRSIDFLALMAAMTLLLAHLDSRRSGGENLLAHQYLSDRAMIEQAQENMREINRQNQDALSAQSADLVQRLLDLDADTAETYSSSADRVSVKETGIQSALPDHDDDAVVSVHIPYFGIIKIAREGMSKESPRPPSANLVSSHLSQPQMAGTAATINTQTLYSDPQIRPSEFAASSTSFDADYGHTKVPSAILQGVPNTYPEAQTQVEALSIPTTSINDVYTHSAAHLPVGLCEPLWPQSEYPELAADGEDWAFQGVDMAFFESLMRSSGCDGGEDMDWTAVGDVGINGKQL